MMALLPTLAASVTLAAQLAGAPSVPPSARNGVCAAIARAVAARVGAAASVTSCDAPDLAGRWTDATPDMSARIGDVSWFTLTGDHTGMRIKATVDVTAPHGRASQALTRGRVVSADDIAADSGSLAGAKFTRLLTAAEITGARVARPIAEGAVFQAADVVVPPLVKSGEPITAVVRIGAVEVTAAMTALDAGSIGDEIRIALADRKRTLRGRIVGPGRVEVMNER
jgi:flagella basal body P-ring formation protein FlgA